jgi:hypothetical protein
MIKMFQRKKTVIYFRKSKSTQLQDYYDKVRKLLNYLTNLLQTFEDRIHQIVLLRTNFFFALFCTSDPPRLRTAFL